MSQWRDPALQCRPSQGLIRVGDRVIGGLQTHAPPDDDVPHPRPLAASHICSRGDPVGHTPSLLEHQLEEQPPTGVAHGLSGDRSFLWCLNVWGSDPAGPGVHCPFPA